MYNNYDELIIFVEIIPLLKFDSTMLPSSISELSLVNDTINNENLSIINSNINHLYIDNIKINNLVIIGNSNLKNIEIINSEIKDLIFDNNPKM